MPTFVWKTSLILRDNQTLNLILCLDILQPPTVMITLWLDHVITKTCTTFTSQMQTFHSKQFSLLRACLLKYHHFKCFQSSDFQSIGSVVFSIPGASSSIYSLLAQLQWHAPPVYTFANTIQSLVLPLPPSAHLEKAPLWMQSNHPSFLCLHPKHREMKINNQDEWFHF